MEAIHHWKCACMTFSVSTVVSWTKGVVIRCHEKWIAEVPYALKYIATETETLTQRCRHIRNIAKHKEKEDSTKYGEQNKGTSGN